MTWAPLPTRPPTPPTHTNPNGSEHPVPFQHPVPSPVSVPVQFPVHGIVPVPVPVQHPVPDPVPGPVPDRVPHPDANPVPGPGPTKSPTNKLTSNAAASDLLGTFNMMHLTYPPTELSETPSGIELPLPPLPQNLPAPSSKTPDIEPRTLPPSSAGVAAASMTSPFPGVCATLPAISFSPTPSRNWPPPALELLQAIRIARSWSPPQPSKPIFKFRPNLLSAKYNMEILHHFNYDIKAAIMHDPNSPLHPGSEFRPVSLLSPIFGNHPSWNQICSTLTSGGHYPLVPISSNDIKSDLEEGIAFGNHKSAVDSKKWMISALNKEIIRGWQLPLPTDQLHLISGALVAPMGNAKQTTIDDQGNRIPKNCLTHNQSMIFGSGSSINSRVLDEELSPAKYGFAFLRFIHLIVALRFKFPNFTFF